MDISACIGTNCPLAKDCYRFTCKKEPNYQSYFTSVPYDNVTNSCNNYWDNKTYK